MGAVRDQVRDSLLAELIVPRNIPPRLSRTIKKTKFPRAHIEKKLEKASSTMFSGVNCDTMFSKASFCNFVMEYC